MSFINWDLANLFPISAEHKQGLDIIYDFLKTITPASNAAKQTYDSAPIRITIMGQPNVGKSTLVNQILGEKRVIVRDEPGVTRDTIAIKAKYLNRDFIINDTAGLRRKSNITDGLETLSALKSLDALEKTDAVILVVDSTGNIENQTLGIAARVYDAGKILAIALNKWDLVEPQEREDKLLKLKHQFKNSFFQIIKPLILPISAEGGTGVKNLMRRVFGLHDTMLNRAPTSLLNRTIEKIDRDTPAPDVAVKAPNENQIRQPSFNQPNKNCNSCRRRVRHAGKLYQILAQRTCQGDGLGAVADFHRIQKI